MSYNKQNFVNGQPLTAQQLNYMENGLVQLNAELDNINTEITNIEDNYATKDFVRSEINNAEIGGDGELDVDLSIYALKTEIPKYIQTGALSDSTIGLNATVEGASNTASGDYSHAEGQNTQATNIMAHAEGNGSIASGSTSHAEGAQSTASGGATHAEGKQTIASGNYSHAEGQKSESRGLVSHAEGYKTIALGDYSHAEGWGYYTTYNNATIGVNSHRIVIPGVSPYQAVDEYLILTFNDCTTMLCIGYYESEAGEIGLLDLNNERAEVPDRFINTTFKVTICSSCAIGNASHTEGLYTVASGNYSHSEGENTIAAGNCQHVQGRYNIADTANTYAHIVGNGTEEDGRSNAHTLDWDGNAWFAGAINCEDKTTTLANLGAAPAVYTYPSVNGIDANTIVNDYHKFVINCANCAYDHGFLDVDKASGEGFSPTNAGPIIQQTMRDWRTGDKAYRTSVDNGATWGEWEWKNPPMRVGVEYRTTERRVGKPVYTKLIEIGQLPNNSTKTVSTGVAASRIFRSDMSAYNNSADAHSPVLYHNFAEQIANYILVGTNVTVTTNHTDFVGYSGSVQIWYV